MVLVIVAVRPRPVGFESDQEGLVQLTGVGGRVLTRLLHHRVCVVQEGLKGYKQTGKPRAMLASQEGCECGGALKTSPLVSLRVECETAEDGIGYILGQGTQPADLALSGGKTLNQ